MCRANDAAIASHRDLLKWPAFANANAIIVRLYVWKLPTFHSACPANKEKNIFSDRAAAENAHAALARAWSLSSPARCSTSLVSNDNGSTSTWAAIANAHAVLTTFCRLKSSSCRSVSLASILNGDPSDSPQLHSPEAANAHAAFASP
eukprot:gnl/TRDRNA2_/TRDRNA2_78980_c0_seq1.p1 gnl/TRDRNA2_/TRDRNA2_78980_c0~~gnl/TRDRNA2_/TRDRNA2_78980_c0_seq1.p1  ORF type:complete len:148 (+),score=7.05 gnl/TRDRNA2_/TRDRNA2_78980_c0_seq1:130-573(+)